MAMTAEQKTSTNAIDITIDVTSDFACPWCDWCHVGYMRFNNALRAIQAKHKIDIFAASSPLQIRWHPYMIDLKTNRNGEPFTEYNQRRWGSDGWFTFGCKTDGQKDGAKFAGFGRENPNCFWANTVNAHRFMWFFTSANKINAGTTGLDLLAAFDLNPHWTFLLLLDWTF